MSGVLNMKNFTRKVVILENLTSPYIHQAIIVLNDYNPANEAKVIKDAEKVVSQYLTKNGYANADNTKTYVAKPNSVRKKKNKFPSMLGIFAALAIAIGVIIKFI